MKRGTISIITDPYIKIEAEIYSLSQHYFFKKTEINKKQLYEYYQIPASTGYLRKSQLINHLKSCTIE